ncbi:MAG: hypothetical protein VW268_14105, partial [Rhodospirillaceae bacterium]
MFLVVMEIADVGARAQAHTRPDWGEDLLAGLLMSALVNNDSGTHGIGETLAALDALDNGATTAVADLSSASCNILRDLGSDQDGDVLRWNGDSNARGSITEKYIGGRLADVLGERAAEDGRAIENSSRAQAEVDVGGRGKVRAEDIERDPSVTGADGARSRVRAIAERISELSPLARENLGLTEQDRANVAAVIGGPDVLFQQQQEGVTARGSIDIGAAEGIVIRLYDAE